MARALNFLLFQPWVLDETCIIAETKTHDHTIQAFCVSLDFFYSSQDVLYLLTLCDFTIDTDSSKLQFITCQSARLVAKDMIDFGQLLWQLHGLDFAGDKAAAAAILFVNTHHSSIELHEL